VTTKDLDAFFRDGWNRHDVDLLMTFMSDQCVFESTAGSEAWGTRHSGRERVREAFAKVFSVFPDARRRASFRLRQPGRLGVALHRHGGRWQEGRGQRLRPLHVLERQDRREELLLQEPLRVI